MEFKLNPQEINYSLAYSFANEVIETVRNPSRVGDSDIVGDFFNFRTALFFDQIGKPNQRTLLHEFIYNINNFGIQHYLTKIDSDMVITEYGPIVDGANIKRPVWFTPEMVEGHIGELSNILERAAQLITDAAFQLLFADRTFLFEFNKFLIPYISQLQPNESPYIISQGVVKRCYFPVWLKNAVFHRDKGRCQLCCLDLTNIMVPTGQRHIDHMVPLKASGTNDPTNFQLACESCNKSKGANVLATNHLTFTYW